MVVSSLTDYEFVFKVAAGSMVSKETATWVTGSETLAQNMTS